MIGWSRDAFLDDTLCELSHFLPYSFDVDLDLGNVKGVIRLYQMGVGVSFIPKEERAGMHRIASEDIPQDWTLIGPLSFVIPDVVEWELKQEAPYGGFDLGDPSLASCIFAYAEDRIGHGGCHFTDSLEEALMQAYGYSDRNELFIRGLSDLPRILSLPARSWDCTAYTDEWGDTWLDL